MSSWSDPSFEEFSRLADEILSPVLRQYGFAPASAEVRHRWTYFKSYSTPYLTINVNYDCRERWTDLFLAIPGTRFVLLLNFVLTYVLDREFEDYLESKNLESDLRAVTAVLEKYATDLLLGTRRLEAEELNGALRMYRSRH